MAELNRSEMPIVRDKMSTFSKSFLNFDNDRPQKFIVLTILAYFGTKIFTNFLDVYTTKTTTEETLDLLTTIVFSGIVFYMTGLNTRPVLGQNSKMNVPFFLGVMVGITEPVLESKYFQPLKRNSPNGYVTLKIILLILGAFAIAFNVFISRTVSAQEYPSTGNYFIYLFIITVIICTLYYSKMTNVVCSGDNCPPNIPSDPNTPVTPQCSSDPPKSDSNTDLNSQPTVLTLQTNRFNISFGISAWLLSLTFVYDSDNALYQTILSSLFGLCVGIYIGNFSTYGVKYTVQSSSVLTETTDITSTEYIKLIEGADITAVQKNTIFNILDEEKYKNYVKNACKISINDKFTFNSNNAKTQLFYNCVSDKIIVDKINTITFYKNEISYSKVAFFILLCIFGLGALLYIINQIIPILQL